MIESLRHGYAHLITSGAQLLLLLIGFRLESRNGWLFTLTLMAAISILAWLSALNLLRTIRDTPTSRIASAAQGYVELSGTGFPFATPVISPLRKLPCLWHRYKIERREIRGEWHVVEHGASSDSFILRDETGECIVDVDQAEILTRHYEQWQGMDGYRYSEWRLIEQDEIYVIGHFRTQGGSSLEFNTSEEIGALLADWKKDMPDLLKRFDLDGNNTLDMQEWMLARSAAQREVAKMKRESQAQPDTNIICQPRDGQLFLVSNLAQSKLARRYLLWSWAHLAIFFGAISGIGWVLQATNF